jgi:TRAP-type C4-dicarboxylate transport system permease small subunit
VTWVGVAAVLVGLGVFAWFVFGDPDIGADAYPYFLVPAAVLLAATIGVARGRVRAGALGLEPQRSTAR